MTAKLAAATTLAATVLAAGGLAGATERPPAEPPFPPVGPPEQAGWAAYAPLPSQIIVAPPGVAPTPSEAITERLRRGEPILVAPGSAHPEIQVIR